MTLLELLVVVSIMMLLAVISVRAMRSPLEARRTREAARSIGVYFSSARNRAMEAGRPVGVEIARDPNLLLAGTTLYQVEVPPPYAGDSTTAVIEAQDWTLSVPGGPPYSYYFADGSVILKVRVSVGSLSGGIVRRGDTICLNFQGPQYRIILDPNPPPSGYPPDFPLDSQGFIDFDAGTDSSPTDGWIDNYVLTLQGVTQSAGPPPWPRVYPGSGSPNFTSWSGPLPFVVNRTPVRSSTAPLRLPMSVAIDLNYSGSGSGSSFVYFRHTATDASSNAITFSPNGAVDRVYGPSFYGARVLNPIYLLVGKRERVPTSLTSGGNPIGSGEPLAEQTSTDSGRNLDDLTSLWVAINPSTGLISCAETHAVTSSNWPPYPDTGDTNRDQRATGDAVFFARQMHNMGGR
jgi:type II secretory pathway pseudopilin PulG